LLDSQSSLRLNLLRFPLIVGVVFIHAAIGPVRVAGSDLGATQTSAVSEFVFRLVNGGIARIAVPLFFLMSGYLFFLGFEWSKQSYFAKLRSRARTLLIPFLFWNVYALLIVAVAQSIPATQRFISRGSPLIASFTTFDYLNALLGLTRHPIAFQFWFIRDLMIAVLLVPLIYFLLKHAPLPFLAVLSVGWFLGVWPVSIPSSAAILFFSAGGYLAWTDRSLFALDRYGPRIVGLYLPVLMLDVLWKGQPYSLYLHNAGVVLGIVAGLYATKLAAESEAVKSWLLGLSSASFFVFAAHIPLLQVVEKSLRVVSPQSTSASLALYFVSPAAVVAILVLAYRVLSWLAPRFTGFVTGGR
jgi:surface polysaccharide O-acyltransferase-like enzyme